MFFIQKKNVLACILALITSLLKLREHWPKFQKQQKNLKKEKNIFVHMAKCLKAKNHNVFFIYIYLYIKQCFSMHFDFNN